MSGVKPLRTELLHSFLEIVAEFESTEKAIGYCNSQEVATIGFCRWVT
jgi:hypothetical protein